MTTKTPSATPLLDAKIKADRCRLYARKSPVQIGYLPTEQKGGHDDILALAISLNLELGWDKYAVGFDNEEA